MKAYWNLVLYSFLLLFTASCVGNPGDEEDDTPLPGDGALTLTASAAYIENNGKDRAEFTVTKGGVDVTEKASILQKKGSSFEKFSGTSFTSNTTGEYTFRASYAGEISESVTITVTTGLIDTPEDPQPDKFSGFKHRILAIQGTSLGCTYCPMMIAGLVEFTKTETSQNTVLAAAHGVLGGDDMISTYSQAVLKSLSVSGIPMLAFNLQSNPKIELAGSDTPTAVSKRIETKAKEYLQADCHTGISVATAGTESSGVIKVAASVKVATTGKYRIAAWVIEDNIYATGQVNGYPALKDEYDFDHHSNVIRCISTSSPVTGTNLGGKAECQAGSTEEFFHEFSLEDMEVENLANARILVFVTRNDGGSRYVVDNVVSCKLNSQVKFEYE